MVTTTKTSEQSMLADAARSVFGRHCPVDLVRALREPGSDGHSPELWSAIAEQDFLRIGLPADCRGEGSLVELGVVFEEAGRALVPTTFRSTVQAALLVAALAGGARGELLEPIVTGREIATVALSEPGAIHDLRYLATSARPDGGGWRISGEKSFVANAHVAGRILVVARVAPEPGDPSGGLGAFCVPAGADGMQLAPQATFAHDRQHRVTLSEVWVPAGSLLGGADEARDWAAAASRIESCRQAWTALLCAEMVGGAQKVVDQTVAYVAGRVQFGRPVGTFQAVQHHLADMTMGVDGGRLAAYQALWRLSQGLPAGRQVSTAKAWTSTVYKDATVMAHQLHGGMGYVKENELHMWSEHAKACELALGARDHHMLRLADEVGA